MRERGWKKAARPSTAAPPRILVGARSYDHIAAHTTGGSSLIWSVEIISATHRPVLASFGGCFLVRPLGASD